MKRKQHNYTPDENVFVLKRHLIDKIPAPDLCDQYSLQPTVFYRWQKEFFENGSSAFEKPINSQQRQQELRIKELEQKLQRKKEVLSELMEEHVILKKTLGRSERCLSCP